MELTGLPSTLASWLSQSMKGLPISWSFSENEDVFIVQLAWKKVKVQIDIGQLHSSIQHFITKPKTIKSKERRNNPKKRRTKKVKLVDSSTQCTSGSGEMVDNSTQCRSAEMVDNSTQYASAEMVDRSTECKSGEMCYKAAHLKTIEDTDDSIQWVNVEIVDSQPQCSIVEDINTSTKCENTEFIDSSTQYEAAKIVENSTQCEAAKTVTNSTQCEPAKLVNNSTQFEPAKSVNNSTQSEPAKLVNNSTQYEPAKLANNSTQCEPAKLANNSTQCEPAKLANNSTQCEPVKLVNNLTQCEPAKTQCLFAEINNNNIEFKDIERTTTAAESITVPQSEKAKLQSSSTQSEIVELKENFTQYTVTETSDNSTQYDSSESEDKKLITVKSPINIDSDEIFLSSSDESTSDSTSTSSESSKDLFQTPKPKNVTVRGRKILPSSACKNIIKSLNNSPSSKKRFRSCTQLSSSRLCLDRDTKSPAKFRCKNWIPRSPAKKHCCTSPVHIPKSFKRNPSASFLTQTTRIRSHSGNLGVPAFSQSPCIKFSSGQTVQFVAKSPKIYRNSSSHATLQSPLTLHQSTNQKLSVKSQMKCSNSVLKSTQNSYNSPSMRNKVPKKRRRSHSMPQK